ncbi:MAG: hypothetical protein Q7P63_15190 [Verrucomicrobiota bacterium JB022]|nr:hypothetical protein [Verrucomicrobiota bacterium JB022]
MGLCLKLWILPLAAAGLSAQENATPPVAPVELPEANTRGFKILQDELRKLVPDDRFAPAEGPPVRIERKAEGVEEQGELERWIAVFEGQPVEEARVDAFDAQTTAEDFYRLAMEIGGERRPTLPQQPRGWDLIDLDALPGGDWIPAWPDVPEAPMAGNGIVLDHRQAIDAIMPPTLRAVSWTHEEVVNPYLDASAQGGTNPYLQSTVENVASTAFSVGYSAAATTDLVSWPVREAAASLPNPVTLPQSSPAPVDQQPAPEDSQQSSRFSSFSSWERR